MTVKWTDGSETNTVTVLPPDYYQDTAAILKRMNDATVTPSRRYCNCELPEIDSRNHCAICGKIRS